MFVYDLSIPIVDGADWYNERTCEPVRVDDVGSFDAEGWRSHCLHLMVLNGTTYLETAAHVYPGAPTIDRVSPGRFLTRAFVVELESNGQELLEPGYDLVGFRESEDAILLWCGWEAQLHRPDYYHSSPYFSQDLQAWLLAHRPSILGGDMLSFDHPQDQAMPFIHEFFRQGGMILCPLVGLERLPDQITLCAAPIKLSGASAAPCRVLAW